MKELDDNQARAMLVSMMIGQTIRHVELGSYLKWNTTINSITLSNGVKINFGGNCDIAYVVDIEAFGEFIGF